MNEARSISFDSRSDIGASTKGKVAYLGYLEGFRGLAIIFVVMIHANNALLQRGVEGVSGSFSWVWTGFHILSHNSTVYFALISGILYSYYLHRKPHAGFLRSRFLAVYVPYTLVSITLTVLIAARVGMGEIGPLVKDIAYNVLFGEAWNHLWYIPVITVLYIISPILLRLVRARSLTWLLVILVMLPLVVSRTATEVTPSMLVYFAGVYTVGLLIGVNPEGTLARLQLHWPAIAGLAFFSACAVAYLDWARIEFLGSTSLRESVIYTLRISLAVLMLIALRGFQHRLTPKVDRVLKLIAAYSFGIYFLHAPLLRPIVKVTGSIVPEGNPAGALVVAVLLTFFASLALSVLLVSVIKRVAGKRSKLIIGS